MSTQPVIRQMTLRDYEPFYGHSEYVKLTTEQIDYAIRHGLKMRKLSLAQGHHDFRAHRKNPLSEEQARRNQALGAVTELAARKHFGYPLRLISENFRDADLPDNVEVRLLGEDRFGLRVYPRTKDCRRVVGIVIPRGKEREPYRIPGWILAKDAKRPEWCITPNGDEPMWAVPQEHLLPLTELRPLLLEAQP